MTASRETAQLLAAKTRRRERLARLPFGKKLEIVEMLRDELGPVRAARTTRIRLPVAKNSRA